MLKIKKIYDFLKSFFNILYLISTHPLNNKNLFSSICNFFSWQLGAFFLKAKVIVRWIDNSYLIIGKGNSGLTGNIYFGLSDYEEMGFLLHTIRPSDTFVDVGANFGSYTVLASKVCGCNSIAFEPVSSSFIGLRNQILLNNISSIVNLRNIGIGSKKEYLNITNNNDTTNMVSLHKNLNIERKLFSTLDDELNNNNNNNNFFIKIDVEGFEYNVLQGSSGVLSSGSIVALIIEMNESSVKFGYSNNEIHKFLTSYGYRPVTYNPKKKKIQLLNDYRRNKNNTIYIKNLNKIKKRISSSSKRIIHTAHKITL